MNNNLKKTKLLTILFDLSIKYEGLPQLRGAIIQLSQFKSDLFHNHADGGVIYRYPLIQYKRIKRKAALLCIEEGANVVYEIFTAGDLNIMLGNKPVGLKVEDIHVFPFHIGVWEDQFHYRLENWLPLNQENYQRYHQMETFHEKVQVLEKVLVGNLLSFCEGIGLKPEKEVRAVIRRIAKEKVVRYRGQMMQAYDIDFSANVSIPNYAGLGKGSGIGFGMVITKKK
ncbi:MAG: CRISPR-associated endonuclease Cas6 [Mangrovibacterium sp.]|nr:CRISPR-associated endonuclease Cas6 [Mangrovibacterium sp.]